MSTIRVGVLRGGPSSEYDVSLKTGASVLANLPSQYRARDILIGKDGSWYMDGIPTSPERVFRLVDVVFNALHGEYGEDGTVQKIMDDHGMPYTGSGTFASMMGMAKHIAKEHFAAAGLPVPKSVVVRAEQWTDPADIFTKVHRSFAPPWVVKPAGAGSSVGVTLAKTADELAWGIEKALFISAVVIVEEYIRGREATCGVVEDFRGQDVYALLPVEIIKPSGKDFFDYDAKYSGETQELCPGSFSAEQKRIIEEYARAAHRAIGARHYSRTDMMVSPRGVYVLEINTLPGLTSASLLPRALAAIGCELPQFLEHIITRALRV